MNVKIIAYAVVSPGSDNDFLEAARLCIAASRGETGVLEYDLWRETGGERRFVFNETYADHAAWQSHLASAHFLTFQGQLAGLVAGAPTVLALEPVKVGA